MAVAEKPIAEKAVRRPQHPLALSSLLGTLYVLFSVGLVFSGLPVLWGEIGIANEFLASALLLLVELGTIVGLFVLGKYLEGQSPPHGLRAGVFVACLAFFVIAWITHGLGLLLAGKFQDMPSLGSIITLGVAGALLMFFFRFFLKPGFATWLEQLEDQGWFHAVGYKANQGVRVRRGSLLGFLTLGICGVITLISHDSLGNDRLGTNNWELAIPFTLVEGNDSSQWLALPLLFRVHYTVPLVLCVILVWVCWRVVNVPAFADFLIATEAEMNKVSWTTRKRLFQDTVVVLITVVILTVFLFVVDILWIKVLSWDFIKVLQVDVRAEQLKQQQKTQW